MYRTNHVLVAHEDRAPNQPKYDRAEERADEAFHSFLGGELDERCTPHGDAPYVREHVVTDDQGGGYPEPDHALEDVVHDEVAGRACQLACDWS